VFLVHKEDVFFHFCKNVEYRRAPITNSSRGKVVPVLNECHEKVCGSGGIALSFFTSALDLGELSASRPCGFTPGDRVPGAHYVGGWAGPRVGIHTMKKTKIFPCRESNHGYPVSSYID
jgi:hypothetical protein